MVDCETTGLGKLDRVVEIAAVTLDSESFEVIDEYDTLINPQRDVGPVHIHGVTPGMVETAPTFEEIAATLGERLDGSILVAHNLRFDARMLSQEFARLQTRFDQGIGVCTLALTHEKLLCACDRYGIELDHHHRALSDARATARLLSHCYEGDSRAVPATVGSLDSAYVPRTWRRDAMQGANTSVLARVVGRAMFPSSDTATVQYLDMLDWVLDDLVIDDLERQDLVALAEELGLSGDMVQRAHANYFQSIVSAAQRDGLITAQENEVMSVVAKALDIDLRLVPRVTVKTVQRGALAAGVRVCFTGTAMVKNRHVDRAELESLAASAGLQPVSSVTKRGCDVLVAADPSSMSGKTQKARQWGISVVSVSDFWRFCSGQ